jgi:predicted TIM-barrel enzyme
VFSEANAAAMAKAGADVIVCHLGLTTGARSRRHSAEAQGLRAADRAVGERCRAVNPDQIVLCHGGPIAKPADASYILKNCPGCNGFYGASSMERLPTEHAITETTRKFKRIKRGAS